MLGKLIAAGSAAEIFEYGGQVVKLYRTNRPKRAAFREASNLALVDAFGLPVPMVHGVRQFDGRWGVIMSRADGQSYADAARREPGLIAEYLAAMARLHLRVHGHVATQLATLKARLAAAIREAKLLREARRQALLDGLAAMPDGDRLCHGDFHPLNILGPPGAETIVDWLDACRGDPAADACRSYVLIRAVAPEIAAAYVEAYAKASGERPERILAWLPFIAAARLAEDVPNEVDGLLELVG